MTRSIILGGTGFIGSYVTQALGHAGHEVTVVSRTQSTESQEGSIEFVEADISCLDSLRDIFYGADNVICLATCSLPAESNRDVAYEVQHHVAATIAAAQVAAECGVKRFVFSSSGGTVYGINSGKPLTEKSPTKPINAYGVSKLSIEHYLRIVERNSSMKTLSLRISNPYGPRQRIDRGNGFIATVFDCLVNERPICIWGDGSVVRDYLHVSDVAHAVYLATNYTGDKEVLNIGSSIGTSLLEIISMIEKITSTRVEVDFEASRSVDVEKNVLCTQLAATELGWAPEISLAEGLYQMANMYKVNGCQVVRLSGWQVGKLEVV